MVSSRNMTPAQREMENAARRRRRKSARERRENFLASEPPPLTEAELLLQSQLQLLAQRTRGNPTDADGDIDFAYRNMALPNVTPLEAPSTSAWQWYLFARDQPNKFLESCGKREDAKAKMAGTITNQRMADDRRNQFEVIDRIEKQLTLDVEAIVNELLEKFPEDVLNVVKVFEAKRNDKP